VIFTLNHLLLYTVSLILWEFAVLPCRVIAINLINSYDSKVYAASGATIEIDGEQ
jgi:hypothetical protein